MTDTDLVRVARAIADPTRLRILRTIASGGTLCCGAITRDVPVRAATVSHHLRILTAAGLVETERDGQFVNVRLNPHRLEELRDAIGSVLAHPAPAAQRSRRRRPRRAA